jgi:hypothetical protein
MSARTSLSKNLVRVQPSIQVFRVLNNFNTYIYKKCRLVSDLRHAAKDMLRLYPCEPRDTTGFSLVAVSRFLTAKGGLPTAAPLGNTFVIKGSRQSSAGKQHSCREPTG